MKSELGISPGLQIVRNVLHKIVRRLPGEHYGKQISQSSLDLSPFYLPRDLTQLVGLDLDKLVRARFFPLVMMPWDNLPGAWVNLPLRDAIEELCKDDIPEYVSSTDTHYDTGDRVVHLEAGTLSGSIRFEESRHPYNKMDIHLSKSE